MALGDGIEPPTEKLTASRSTTELPKNETGASDRIRTDVISLEG
jgi:hypothetical protein